MVTVVALVADPLLQPGRETLASTTLRLPKSVFSLAQFMGMRNLLAIREGNEGMKAWVNAYRTMASMWNGVGLRIDKETEIPPRRPLDDAPTFEPSCREVLRMKADMPYPWNVDTCALWSFERIRERDARQLVPLAFEPWLLRQLLRASLPGRMGHVEQALQGVTGDAELFAVIGKQIVEGFWAVIDAVFRILFNLADRPIPDPCQLKEPCMELGFLRSVETKLKLPLDHLTPVSGFR